MRRKPIIPTKPDRIGAPTRGTWKEVGTLTVEHLIIGVPYSGGTNNDMSAALDDHITGVQAIIYQVKVSRGIRPNTKLNFDVRGPNPSLLAEISIILHFFRTNSRTYRLKVGYLPGLGGGKLEFWTILNEGGSTFASSNRSLGAVTYQGIGGVEGEDDSELVSNPFKISENYNVGSSIIQVEIGLYATPLGPPMGGTLQSITLEKYIKS